MLSEGRFGVSRTRRVRKHPRALSLTRRQSVSRPWQVRRRATAHLGMSQNVGNRQMPARPPPVRSPSLARGESAACREATIPMAEGGRADVHNRPLHPVSRRARTPHEPTQDERHTGSDRTQNEQPTNTDAPARQATLSTPPTVNRPWIARLQPVSRPYLARVQSVRSLCAARVKSVRSLFAARVNPSRVRDMTFVSPCSGRQRACSHKGSRSLDEIHYAIWRIFTGGIASSSDFMGRKGPFSGVPVVSNSEQFSRF